MGCFLGCFRIKDDGSRKCHVLSKFYSWKRRDVVVDRNQYSSIVLSEEKGSPTGKAEQVFIEENFDGDDSVHEKLRQEAKFLKTCGAILETPMEIRQASFQQSAASDPYSIKINWDQQLQKTDNLRTKDPETLIFKEDKLKSCKYEENNDEMRKMGRFEELLHSVDEKINSSGLEAPMEIRQASFQQSAASDPYSIKINWDQQLEKTDNLPTKDPKTLIFKEDKLESCKYEKNNDEMRKMGRFEELLHFVDEKINSSGLEAPMEIRQASFQQSAASDPYSIKINWDQQLEKTDNLPTKDPETLIFKEDKLESCKYEKNNDEMRKMGRFEELLHSVDEKINSSGLEAPMEIRQASFKQSACSDPYSIKINWDQQLEKTDNLPTKDPETLIFKEDKLESCKYEENNDEMRKMVRFEELIHSVDEKINSSGLDISPQTEEEGKQPHGSESPYPTPLNLLDEMQTPGTIYPPKWEKFKTGRIRAQFVYPLPALSQSSFVLCEDREKTQKAQPSSLNKELRPPLPKDGKKNMMERSHSDKSPNEDRPIIIAAAASLNDEELSRISPKQWDGNGIPNSTTKYKEDQRVSWHATPFEVRLEKALWDERVYPPRKIDGGLVGIEDESRGYEM